MLVHEFYCTVNTKFSTVMQWILSGTWGPPALVGPLNFVQPAHPIATPLYRKHINDQYFFIILFIPRSHSYCLSLPLCLEWYNGSITPRLHSGVTKRIQCRLYYQRLNKSVKPLWSVNVRLTLTYPTPDNVLTYTYILHCFVVSFLLH